MRPSVERALIDDPGFRATLAEALGPDYELGGLVGQGGFGRVYEAKDLRLGRRLAVKVIRPDLAGASAFVQRFRQEGVALARLRHPSVVPIYDIKEANGLIFYTMPFIDGPTLAAKLERRGALPPKVAQRVLMELCDAVAATHRAGILHRDIKPSNVILEGAQEKVLLTDFGIARVVGAGYDTESGQVLGTPTYMSPEHASGGGAVDERSDIYSLGVVGYHLLTGHPPFEGETPMAVVIQHASAAPEPIRRRFPSVPYELADAVERALCKAPEDRHQSVMDMWEQLGRATFFRETGEALPPEPPRPLGVLSVVFGLLGVGCFALALRAETGRPLDVTVLAPWQWIAASMGCAVLAILLSPVVRARLRDWRPRWAFWSR